MLLMNAIDTGIKNRTNTSLIELNAPLNASAAAALFKIEVIPNDLMQLLKQKKPLLALKDRAPHAPLILMIFVAKSLEADDSQKTLYWGRIDWTNYNVIFH